VRADHHVGATLQALELRRVTLSAVDRQHVEARHLRGIFLEGFGHLDGELARGREDQGLGFAQLDIDFREDGQRECGRLAGARLRLAEQVGATQDHRDGLRLDGRGCFVAHVVEGGDDGVAQSKLSKAGWGSCFSHRCCGRRGNVPISRHRLERGAQFTLNPLPRHENRAKSAIRRPKSTLSGRARVLPKGCRHFRLPASPGPRNRLRSAASSERRRGAGIRSACHSPAWWRSAVRSR
jgi:hypothetical protein